MDSGSPSLCVFGLGSRTINKDWFGMPMPEVWDILSEQLYFVVHAYKIKVKLFVAMSNHFHLLALDPGNVLPSAMQYFLAQSSRQITKSCGRINHTWRARHFRSQIQSTTHYLHAYKYYYRNPVEAGICARVEDYPFSTLTGLLGQTKLLIPVEHDDTLFSDVEGTLAWLNQAPKHGYKEAVKNALRRKSFRLPRDQKTSRVHPLESERY